MGLPWTAFGRTLHAQMSLGSLCFGFLSSPGLLYAEKLVFVISTPLSYRSCFLCRSWRARWSHLGQKSHAKSVGMANSCLEGASRSKVWTVSARWSVGVMGTAGNGRDSAENQVKSEAKVCLSDKSYDTSSRPQTSLR